MASITKNKLTVVAVVAILAIMLLPSMIDSSSVTNSTTNATTNNTTIQSTTITTAITANTCSTSSYAYGISTSGVLSCNQVSGTVLQIQNYTLEPNLFSITSSGNPSASTAVINASFTKMESASGLLIYALASLQTNNASVTSGVCFVSNIAGSIPTGSYKLLFAGMSITMTTSSQLFTVSSVSFSPFGSISAGTISLYLNCYANFGGTSAKGIFVAGTLLGTELIIEEIS